MGQVTMLDSHHVRGVPSFEDDATELFEKRHLETTAVREDASKYPKDGAKKHE